MQPAEDSKTIGTEVQEMRRTGKGMLVIVVGLFSVAAAEATSINIKFLAGIKGVRNISSFTDENWNLLVDGLDDAQVTQVDGPAVSGLPSAVKILQLWLPGPQTTGGLALEERYSFVRETLKQCEKMALLAESRDSYWLDLRVRFPDGDAGAVQSPPPGGTTLLIRADKLGRFECRLWKR
jgi:hypothetical protein